MNRVVRMFLALSCCVCLSGAGADLSTTAGINGLYLNGPTAADIPFAVTGTVTHVLSSETYGRFVLRDASGHVVVHHAHETLPKAGDVVVAQGVAFVDGRLATWTDARRVDVVGRASVPAPCAASVAEIQSGKFDFRNVCVTGTVSECVIDDVELDWRHAILHDGHDSVTVSFRKELGAGDSGRNLLNARVAVTGVCLPQSGDWRSFQGCGIMADGITTVSPAPADPFDVPQLDPALHGEAERIFGFGRRSVRGTVMAVWHGDRLLVRTSFHRLVEVGLADGQSLPRCGDAIRAVGFPGTNLFSIDLANAIWRAEDGLAPAPASAPVEMTAEELMPTAGKHYRFLATSHGRLVRMRGVVRGLATVPRTDARFYLESDGRLLPVDISSCPGAAGKLAIGSTVRVTGICLMETDVWKPNAPLPRIRGFQLLLRTAADLEILSRPPWWTPGKLLAVIGSLLLGLVGVFVWNRILNRLVERRSRQLRQEQAARAGEKLKVGERTRLAVELHDSLSQTLTGVSFQIDAAERARRTDPSRVGRYLDVARRTLQSCREDLRNCLWDLRNNALEEPQTETAVRRTLEPHVGDAELKVSFEVPRKLLPDNIFHAVLCILRELTTNAVRHGAARHVVVGGTFAEGKLRLTVDDDGCGFDPRNRPGADEGHFGLLGVSERIETLGGTLEIRSARGKGTQIRISIPL